MRETMTCREKERYKITTISTYRYSDVFTYTYARICFEKVFLL